MYLKVSSDLHQEITQQLRRLWVWKTPPNGTSSDPLSPDHAQPSLHVCLAETGLTRLEDGGARSVSHSDSERLVKSPSAGRQPCGRICQTVTKLPCGLDHSIFSPQENRTREQCGLDAAAISTPYGTRMG